MLRPFFLVVPFVLAAGACAPTVSFDVPVDGEATVAGAGGGIIDDVLGSIGFDGFNNLDFDNTSEFQNNDVSREHVSSARIKSLHIAVVDPADANFDWIDEITFTVSAENEDTVQVASKIVPDGVGEFDCDLDDVELAPYVRQESVQIRTQADARNPPQDTTIRVEIVFGVTADVL